MLKCKNKKQCSYICNKNQRHKPCTMENIPPLCPPAAATKKRELGRFAKANKKLPNFLVNSFALFTFFFLLFQNIKCSYSPNLF